MTDLDRATQRILKMRTRMPAEQSLLAGISGIDASGKGYVARLLETELQHRGLRIALISADDWLNLPHVRFSKTEPGRHFYQNALRLDDMFERLILPLKYNRSICLKADLTRETAKEHHDHTFSFKDIDVVLIEGIFIFKPLYARHFDLKIWIECGFETALKRAIVRSQEGLDEAETVRSYKTVFFPAQSIHLNRDHPVAAADIVIDNN